MKSKKTKTRQELAIEMGICPKTLNRWLKKYQIEIPNGLLTPLQQQKIKEQLGFEKWCLTMSDFVQKCPLQTGKQVLTFVSIDYAN